MNDIVAALVLCVGIPIIFCVAIPFLVMAMLAASLEEKAPKAPNFRGTRVYNGLGIVWFVWLISFWIGAQFIEMLHMGQPYWVALIARLFPLIAGSCAFGLFDDWAGCNNTKGFKGHLKALAKGHLTTGGLKFLGIGFLSLFISISLFYHGAESIPRVILCTCVIALMANLMNLFDLRPGRAQKMYLVSLVFALAFIFVFGMVAVLGNWGLIALAIAALGPLIATWRFDLGEKGMLGDAGANSMGAFLGFLFAIALPDWALLVLAIALVAVNLLSEKVSFSKIIDNNTVLSFLDGLGRKKDINNEKSETEVSS
ncbi:MAG TPA: hypothetical protein DEB24_04325 [Coriobacteriia bacterium]|nr:hypothetical protein [Coriobacteriia bacterium]